MSVHQKFFFILQHHKKQVIVASFFIMMSVIFYWLNITNYFSPTYLQENVTFVHTMVKQNYYTALCIYLLSYISACALSIPGSTLFLTAAGFLFGTLLGCVLSLIGATIGATILFFTSRYLMGSLIQQYFREKLLRFNAEIEAHGFYYLLMVRLIGLLPFCVVNLLSGITLLQPTTFVWTTCVGMIPFALVYAFIGSQLSQLTSSSYFSSPIIIMVLISFYIFKITLVPFFYAHVKKRRAHTKKRNFTNRTKMTIL